MTITGIVLAVAVALLAVYVCSVTREIDDLRNRLLVLSTSLTNMANANKNFIKTYDGVSKEYLEWFKAITEDMKNIVTNLEATDKRVTEIERYYVTYVARKEDDNGKH